MPASKTASLPREGDIIDGKYRVERVLGEGGMGVVVAARHLRLDEQVALKFLLPDASVTAELTARFEREARAASKIKNEHVARVTDVGTLESGSPYMVMEYLEGTDLSTWLADRGRLPIERAVDFLLQTCEAVGEAHALGIIHRDLKPANLFATFRSDGQPLIKVLDFGISKLMGPGPDSSMTRTQSMLGSPAYMSPEQMQASKDVDARTDIWALGIILFELVTGRPPFESESMTGLAIKIATERLVSMRSLRADIPVGLDLVVEKCLEKDRTQRYSSIGELALALKSFAPEYARISVDRIVGTERRSIASVKNPRPPSVPGVPDEPPTLREIPTVAATMPAATDAWGKTGRGAAPSSRGARVAIVLFLASAALVASFAVATLRSKPPEVPPVGLVASGPSLPPSAEASAPAPSPPAPVTPPVARPSAEIVPEAPVVPRPPPRAAAPASRPASPPPSAKLGPSAAHSNCNPPYIVNAQGEHVYKPECL